MKLVILHKHTESIPDSAKPLLQSAIETEPLAGLIVDGLSTSLDWCGKSRASCAIPQEYATRLPSDQGQTAVYAHDIPVNRDAINKTAIRHWHLISDGQFVSHIDTRLLETILSHINADVVALTVQPSLRASQERMRLTPQGDIAGIRRVYEDSTEIRPMPSDWPHHLFIGKHALDKILTDSGLPGSFTDLMQICKSHSLTMRALNAGGTVTDLSTSDGLLSFITGIINAMPRSDFRRLNPGTDTASAQVPDSARLIGKIFLGKGLSIGNNVVIVGPAAIGNDVTIEDSAVVGTSVIGPGLTGPADRLVQNSILLSETQLESTRAARDDGAGSACSGYLSRSLESRHIEPIFRKWHRLSYAGCLKRIADIVFASAVLLLFAPVIPFIAAAIKLNSPGPIFFRHRREGLRGKPFDCIKFRSMHVGSDQMQDKLRMISQVDGPQFKMDDDPRISKVGRFLRETYIDEIPQFINVLMGHMSVIGPRPSPRKENTQCPHWRDARLSVRPGITGLWQINRTRLPMRDFQEWIHYDVQYVKTLSLKTDLVIFWKTFTKLVDNFIKQF